jgi:3-hydroxyisobutyrate dehydrogenase
MSSATGILFRNILQFENSTAKELISVRVGFIGLGNLGRTMAVRLQSQGVDLVVWNRTPEKAAGINAIVVSSPAEVIDQTEIVFLSLFDSEAVNSVLNGTAGLLTGDCRGKIVIDTTTNHFDEVSKFYSLLDAVGAFYLEAPVLGSVVPASQGTLTVLVSGEKEPFERATPYLEKISKRIFYLSEKSLATKMKLVNNLVLGSFMATLAEALTLGERVGIERATVLDILGAGAGNSTVLTGKREKLLQQDFSPHFSIAAIHKDLHYLEQLAERTNQGVAMGDAARTIYDEAMSQGLAGLDCAALYLTLQNRQ